MMNEIILATEAQKEAIAKMLPIRMAEAKKFSFSNLERVYTVTELMLKYEPRMMTIERATWTIRLMILVQSMGINTKEVRELNDSLKV